MFAPKIVLLCLLLHAITAYTNPSTCTELYNYLTHSCESCPPNTAPHNIGYCNCTKPYYPNPEVIGFNHADSCIDLGVTLSSSEIIIVRDVDGSVSPVVASCSSDAYPNPDGTACIPCGIEMTYNPVTERCECTQSNFVIIGDACVQKSAGSPYSNPQKYPTSTDITKDLYDKAVVGCIQNEDHDSCQILINQCARQDYNNNTNFCQLIINNPNSLLQFRSTYNSLKVDLGIYASSIPGTDGTTVKNKLNFKLFKYDRFGRLVDIKPLDRDIIPCIATDEDIIKLQSFGLNLKKTCTPNDVSFDQNYYYDVFVLNANSQYVQVFAVSGASSTYYRRLLPGGLSSSIQLVFSSIPPLSTPYLNMSAASDPSILTSSQQDTVNLTLTAPFIVFNIGLLIIYIINFYKYLKYNPDETNDPSFCFKMILMFLLMAMRYWGVGMWIFLFGTSAYCFCFYKFQQTVFLLLPDMVESWFPYYHSFMALFYVQFAFLFFSILLLVYDMSTSTDYFLIDWQKQKNDSKFDVNIGYNKRQASVWRKVLLVNELYEITINRLINIQFVTLFALLFLNGLKWINLSYQIPNTQDLDNDSSTTKNVVLSYFIISFVFFIIAIGQYIIRHLFRIWFPLPHEDFVDLCAISNISIIIFDEALHGYYIHGMNPFGQAEGSLQYIESVFEKEARSFGKSRAFRNDDPDQIQTFEVLFPFEVRQAFQMKYKTQYEQKLIGKAYNTSMFSKPIPEMLDENDYKEIQTIQTEMLNSFKYYLEGVKTSQFNVKDRTFLQKLISCPISMQLIGKLPIFFKDHWHSFTNVLMSGHQFIFLMNTINFINIFYVATQNIFMAVFITMIITRIFIKNFADYMVKRNISKNTLIDDKFFN